MDLLRNYFVFNYTYQSAPNEKNHFELCTVPKEEVKLSQKTVSSTVRFWSEPAHATVSRLSKLEI